MHIVQEIKGLVGFIVKQVLLVIGFVIVAGAAPVVLAVLPQVLILQDPHASFSDLGQLFIWATPLSVAFWMMVLCHFHSIRLWLRKNGKSAGWMQAHGGAVHTNVKSTGFMVLGLIGAFLCEVLFLIAFKHVPYETFHGAARWQLWFALFPFAAFAPVLLLLFNRRHYAEITDIS